jgi:hypothetical protein
LLGASNAGKTAAALERAGMEVLSMNRVGWVVSKDSMEASLQELDLEVRDTDAVVLHCLDNSVFYMVDQDTGSMALPKRGEDGIYHVTGRVVVAKELQLEFLLEKLEPALLFKPDNLKVLVYPTVRYLDACCTAHGRSSSMREEDGNRLLKELAGFRKYVKAFLIKKKIRNVLVVDPLAVLGGQRDLMVAHGSMEDNIHMSVESFNKIGAHIKNIIAGWLLGRKRKATGDGELSAKRARAVGWGAGRGSLYSRGGRGGRGGRRGQ